MGFKESTQTFCFSHLDKSLCRDNQIDFNSFCWCFAFFFFKASANKADKLGLLFFLTTLDSLIILAIVNTVKYKFRYSPLVQLCFQSTVNTFPCLWYGDSCCGNEPQ